MNQLIIKMMSNESLPDSDTRKGYTLIPVPLGHQVVFKTEQPNRSVVIFEDPYRDPSALSSQIPLDGMVYVLQDGKTISSFSPSRVTGESRVLLESEVGTWAKDEPLKPISLYEHLTLGLGGPNALTERQAFIAKVIVACAFTDNSQSRHWGKNPIPITKQEQAVFYDAVKMWAADIELKFIGVDGGFFTFKGWTTGPQVQPLEGDDMLTGVAIESIITRSKPLIATKLEETLEDFTTLGTGDRNLIKALITATIRSVQSVYFSDPLIVSQNTLDLLDKLFMKHDNCVLNFSYKDAPTGGLSVSSVSANSYI